jgi:hypothetical protein
MAAVSETIVREYFELHGFFVRQQRKYVAPAKTIHDEEADFYVVNPHPLAGRAERPRDAAIPFVLSSSDLPAIGRAVVVVKGWHTDTFSPARLAHVPEIFRFVEPPVVQQALRAFGRDGPLLKLMVVPALPQNAQQREQTIELLRGRGLDGVIPFATMLGDLISQIEVNRNYQKSDLLQIIRILKNYDFIKDRQLELFKPRRSRKRSPMPAKNND